MINLVNAYKIYNRGSVKALNDVSLTVLDGDYLSVVGESGSGKTTLVNILGCLDRLTRGRYFIDGNDVSELSDDRLSEIRNTKIGFVFQNFNLIDKMNAVQNVEVPLVFKGIPPEKRYDLAIEALDSVGLSHRTHNFPSEMSGGQQQRVAIARAIVTQPSIIIADEPTGNLDRTSADMILSIFDELSKNGRTIIMITHDTRVSRKAHRVIELRNGKITS